jgi:hypothetical protein
MKKLCRALTGALLVIACEQPAGPDLWSGFVAVTGITSAPLGGKKGAVLNLGAARVVPEDASRRDIGWVLLDGGSTGITEGDLKEGRPVPGAPGALKLRAVVAGGLGKDRDYTQDMTIAIIDDAVSDDFVAAQGIAGVPLGGMKGHVLDLSAARVLPEDATRQLIDWILIDGGTTGLAGEDLGESKPVPPAAGTAKLLAVVAGGLGGGAAYTQEFTLSIADAAEDILYSIGVGSLSKGSLAADPAGAAAGTEIVLTVSPDPGYRLKPGSLRANDLALNGGEEGYSFVMPPSDVILTAEFEAILYRTAVGSLARGSVAARPESAAPGTEITLIASPDPGYALKAGSLKVNDGGVELRGSGLVYVFAMPASDAAVAAVFEALPEGVYTVGIGEIHNGSINASPASAAAGTVVALTASPAAGYALKPVSLKINNGAVAVSGSGGAYTFVMPPSDVTAAAEFEAIPHSVSIAAMSHGSIAADPPAAILGTAISLTVSPDPGYTLKPGSLKVNDGAAAVSGSGDAYSFVMPPSDATVAAEFEETAYRITMESMSGGSFVANPVAAAAGTGVSLTAISAAGYALKPGSLKVNDGAAAVSGSGDVYSFVMPPEDVRVAAEFEAVFYKVTPEPLANGSIRADPPGGTAGTTVILTAEPDPGYMLKPGSLEANGGAVSVSGLDTVHVFVMPPEDVRVAAEFEEDPSRILERLELGSPPDTLVYLPGEEFDPAGLAVYVVYRDGRREELDPSEYRIDTSKISGTGNQRVFIRKEGLDSLAILIFVDPSGRVLKSAVLAAPPPASQEMGKDFNTAGMAVTGTYADGTTEQLDPGLCKVRGYDKWKRGTQRVSFSINGITLAAGMEIRVKLPPSAAVEMVELSGGKARSLSKYLPGDSTLYRPVYIKGMPFDLAQANLRPVVTLGGQKLTLSWGNGLGPGDTVTGYNAHAPGRQTLSLALDDFTGTFDVYVLDAEPQVYFDYGYMRHGGDPRGRGPGAGIYYARPEETLILSPIRYLIGYDAENRDLGASYSWSVTGGAYDTAAGTTGETFAFTPRETGTYTVTVSVTGRNFVTGLTDTKTASTEALCYGGTLPAGNFVSPLKNFSPGQFTESGTGYGWSLGAALGYEVFRIDPSGGFTIDGNAFGGWEEPGIAWVQEDRNGNGLPDEMWYELTGSDETNPLTKPYITRRYAIQWFLFAGDAERNQYGQIIRSVCWVDSKGRAGTIAGGWPADWGVSGDRVLYTGTILRDGQGKKLPPQDVDFPQGMAGYADCYNEGTKSIYVFSKDAAIRADGSPANLGNIHFVKVQTALFGYGGIFGEFSTEIVSATGLEDQSGGFPSPLGSVNR